MYLNGINKSYNISILKYLYPCSNNLCKFTVEYLFIKCNIFLDNLLSPKHKKSSIVNNFIILIKSILLQ
ncbi:hypothetical protein AMV103 [Betaentomopoxvirus amoorei]|uniref:AMV103 n=1 Tax=Amsacta moorei entomopoxvirus TaxID=28321 RepID=Q9EMU6_AMEPV|nr:hypothetical protein AMV103 [Amsacta moorei entomopoxvirus]AAG02809.1 AMV103 [Amsacta moorei entomopoxvirus]